MFQIGDYVSFYHHSRGTIFGTITQIDEEDNGWEDDDGIYHEEESYLSYYVEYDTPFPDVWGGEESGWWADEEAISLAKKERVPTGFAVFVKKLESGNA